MALSNDGLVGSALRRARALSGSRAFARDQGSESRAADRTISTNNWRITGLHLFMVSYLTIRAGTPTTLLIDSVVFSVRAFRSSLGRGGLV